MTDVAQAWQKLMTAVNQTLAFGDDPNKVRFQISINPQEYDFVGPNGLFNFYNFANLIPLWQAGFLDSDNKVTVQYAAFLNDINPTDRTIDQNAEEQLKALRPQVRQAKKDLDDYQRSETKAWQDFNAGQQGIPDQFKKDFQRWLNEDFVPGLTEVQETYNDLQGQADELEVRAFGSTQEYKNAKDNLQKSGFPYQENIPVQVVDTNGKTVTQIIQLPAWDMQPLPSQILQDIQQGRVNSVSFTVTSETEDYKVSSWEAGGSAGLDLGFISIGTSGGASHVNIDASHEKFKLTFSAVSTNSIVMTPRDWFDQGVLARYKNAPGAEPFFGRAGVFNLLKRRAWLVYQPTITLELDRNRYQEAIGHWSAGASLSIGPFSFGGGASGSSDEIHFDDQGASITASSKSPLLQAFALSSLVLPG